MVNHYFSPTVKSGRESDRKAALKKYASGSAIDTAWNNMKGTFEMYLCDAGSKQNFLMWKYTPPGSATLVKSSTDSNATGLGYNFSGIKYGIYSNQACTSSVGTFTVNRNPTIA